MLVASIYSRNSTSDMHYDTSTAKNSGYKVFSESDEPLADKRTEHSCRSLNGKIGEPSADNLNPDHIRLGRLLVG